MATTDRSDGYLARFVSFLRFVPGGLVRLFGPSIAWLALRPVLLDMMPEPQYGAILFGVFFASVLWANAYSRRFKN